MNMACKMVLTAAMRCAQMLERTAEFLHKIRMPLSCLSTLQEYRSAVRQSTPPVSNSYSMGQLDMLTVHDVPIDTGLLRKTHAFDKESAGEAGASPAGSYFSIGFRRRLFRRPLLSGRQAVRLELFHRSWKNVCLSRMA